MKNKNVIDTLNSILPTNDEKEKILSNILNNKKSNSYNFNSTLKIAVLASSICITFFLAKGYNDKQLAPNTRMMPISAPDVIIFSYNNVTYERIGEISDLDNLKGKLLFVVEDNTSPYFTAEVYENKTNNNTVLIYFNGIYEEYKICE